MLSVNHLRRTAPRAFTHAVTIRSPNALLCREFIYRFLVNMPLSGHSFGAHTSVRDHPLDKVDGKFSTATPGLQTLGSTTQTSEFCHQTHDFFGCGVAFSNLAYEATKCTSQKLTLYPQKTMVRRQRRPPLLHLMGNCPQVN